MANNSISSITIGVSSTGVSDYYKKIRAVVMEDAVNQISKTDAIKAALKDGWKGQAEEAFEKNMDNATLKLKQTLQTLTEGVESSLASLIEDWAQHDQQLIKEEEF